MSYSELGYPRFAHRRCDKGHSACDQNEDTPHTSRNRVTKIAEAN